MRYLPITFDLQDRQVLVVGAGAAAREKLQQLGETPARLTWWPGEHADNAEAPAAPPVATDFTPFAPHREAELARFDLIYLIGDAADNAAIARAARQLRIPLNWVDRPHECDFITPALVARGDVTVSISTAGGAPMLARQIKVANEMLLPHNLGEIAEKAARLRPIVKRNLPDAQQRRAFWHAYFAGALNTPADPFDANGKPRAARITQITAPLDDADDLTLKALRQLQSADVVLFDSGVARDILRYARADAEKVEVTNPDAQTPAADYARRGCDVVYLRAAKPARQTLAA